MKKRVIELNVNNRQEYLQLVVNPATLEFTDTQNNQQINLLEIGTALLLGNRGLISVTLESFFPSERSPPLSEVWRKKDTEGMQGTSEKMEGQRRNRSSDHF